MRTSRARRRAGTRDTSAPYGERYQAATDVVMAHINAPLDPEYQLAEGAGASKGVSRSL